LRGSSVGIEAIGGGLIVSQAIELGEVHFWRRVDEPGRFNLAARPEPAGKLLGLLSKLRAARWPLNCVFLSLPRRKRSGRKWLNPVSSLVEFVNLRIAFDAGLERAYWVDEAEGRLILAEEGLARMLLHLEDLVNKVDDDATWSEGPDGSDEQAIWFWSM
jgi:hypothetical protein